MSLLHRRVNCINGMQDFFVLLTIISLKLGIKRTSVVSEGVKVQASSSAKAIMALEVTTLPTYQSFKSLSAAS